jgi:dTDP-4-amino-4,6-dideoxygalactose transaminase
MTHPHIPLQNLINQNSIVRDMLIADFIKVLDSGRFVSGLGVEKFESDFADYVGSSYCTGVSTGSSALSLALQSVGVGRGDEVIVPSLTFIATIEAVLEVNAVPVLIDIDPLTWNIDHNLIEESLTSKTKVILPVHLHGRLADMGNILEIAKKNNLIVVEDAAQAHGAQRGKFKAGSSSSAAAFSFYPGKNLGALGEAGALTTNSMEINDWTKRARNYGSEKKYHHIHRGNNYRMDELQSYFLSVKLKYLNEWTDKRILAAQQYNVILDSLGVKRTASDTGRHVYHIYSVLIENRDKVMASLNSKNIGASSHYPIPCHLQKGYRDHVKIGSKLNNSEYVASRLLSLPLDESITKSQIQYVCEELRKAIHQNN